MRNSEDYTFIFRNDSSICSPSKGLKQPSAKFSPHNDMNMGPEGRNNLKIYILQFLSRTKVLTDEQLTVICILSHVELHDV